MDWAHMTHGGAQNIPGNWTQDSGTAPIVGGLFNGYAMLTIREDFLRLEEHGFHADGTYIDIMDSVEIGVDPGPDTDGDGMRDAWEIANGLDHTDPTGVNGADGDLDLDRQPNIWEMIAGTVANDANSVFRALSIGADSGGDVLVTWSSVPGKRYGIDLSVDMTSWSPWMSGGTNVVIDALGRDEHHPTHPPSRSDPEFPKGQSRGVIQVR